MKGPFPKSTSTAEKCRQLQRLSGQDRSLVILINADPDAMASALALKRLFWRKFQKTCIYRINSVKRADNLAFIKLLNVDLRHVRQLNASSPALWALLDSQPHHDPQFARHDFNIIVDHHPVSENTTAEFVDIQESYGATSTIFTEYLKTEKIKPSPRLATALFYGIKTDTDNFARDTSARDMNAFKYLYPFVNGNILKKIESSEMTRKTLTSFKKALEAVIFYKQFALVHMGKIKNPDNLVIIADFFLKIAEVTWSIISGIYGQKLVVILRNAGFRRNAGKLAQNMFADLGSAGGHHGAARAEIPLRRIEPQDETTNDLKRWVLIRLKLALRS